VEVRGELHAPAASVQIVKIEVQNGFLPVLAFLHINGHILLHL
jgi:hypothetical protein